MEPSAAGGWGEGSEALVALNYPLQIRHIGLDALDRKERIAWTMMQPDAGLYLCWGTPAIAPSGMLARG